jgi:serine/threonine-protein kinase
LPVEHLGRYELLGELGRGAMGVVYKARDPKIDRLVALKLIAPAEGLHPTQIRQRRERFQREARAAGRLAHPNIVTVYDVGEDQGRDYLVMEFIEGQSLDQILRTRRPLPLDEALSIGEDVAQALDYAHGHGIIHRDVKPANILLARDGVAKVTDFGIARITGTDTTQTGQSLGTPSYMSPEQISGLTLDGRSDIFSLGAVLYELLSGERAFPGETISTVIYRIIHEEPTPLRRLNPAFPAGLDICLRKALVKDPSRRYPRAADLARDLRRAAEGVPLSAESELTATAKIPTPSRGRSQKRARRPLWPWLLAAGAAVAGLALFPALRLRTPEQPPAPSSAPPVSRAVDDAAAKARAVAEEAARQKAAEEETQRKTEADQLAAEKKRIEEEKALLARQQAAIDAERRKAAEEAARRKAAEQEEALRPRPGAIQRRGLDNAEMVYIPAGTFTMGDTHGEGLPNERPGHPVSLPAFWVDRTEVTNTQFVQFARAAGFRPRPALLREAQGKADHPVVHVTWEDAVAYCRWAGKRLPTEAEWEYAARGTDGRRYPWGDTWDPSRARFEGNNGGQTTAPVGSYPAGASPFGVLDLAGNVWEWTSSLERPYPYVASDGREDPAAPGQRVTRGGGWRFRPGALRTTVRWGLEPTNQRPVIGFRCAQS